MKKDIEELRVEDFAVCIVPRDENDDDIWDVYAINLSDEEITNVFISSRGFGIINGEERKTSKLRHFFESLGPLSIVLVEPILKTAFDLTNEYWVSFTQNGHMYDKKYVFVVGSIDSANFTLIPFIDKKGVMIR